MDKNQNKYLAVSLGFLVIVSVALFLGTREEDRPETNRMYFAVAETEKIDRVQLISATDSVDLMYDGSRWKVNGQWDADLQMIKVLMATLRQAEPHRPVATLLTDSVRNQLLQRGTRVTLSEGGQPRMSFRAGGNFGKTESWFLKENDDQPYIMIIPGYRVYVSGILQLDAGGWRDKRIFGFNWRNFKSLTTIYPREPAEGFSIEMKHRYFGITGIQHVDTTKLNDYLDAISLLMAKRFIASDGQEAGTRSPLARIEIRDIADRIYTLELFMPGDSDREVYGRMSDGQGVAFDPEVISSIVRRRTYFVAGKDR